MLGRVEINSVVRAAGVECDQLSTGLDVLRSVHSKNPHQIHIRAIYCTFSTTLLSASEKDSHVEMKVKMFQSHFGIKVDPTNPNIATEIENQTW